MNRQTASIEALDSEPEVGTALAALAPRPRSIADTGLSVNFLSGLAAKHFYSGGVLTIPELSDRTALAGPVLEDLIALLRGEACVEVRSAIDGGGLRYALTDKGRALALDALAKSGYIGAAPVTVKDYARVTKAQSVHSRVITRSEMEAAFSDVVLKEHLLDQLGPALHSGRPIFLYGPPGAGKTYVAKMLSRLLCDDILIPRAIAQGDQVIQFFDPVYHHPVDERDNPASVMLEQGYDTRFLRCKRPAVITGGELNLDMLEMAYDPSTRQYQAPLQLKANNGIYMIDDLGRQRADVTDLLNRWIVPMEESQDYLSLGSGEHFAIPFEVVLIFSTNMDPLELADEAFLRRLGYKIKFDYLNTDEFDRIWAQVCAQRGIELDTSVLQYVKHDLYKIYKTPMLPCHPRDLIGLALDQACYQGRDAAITIEDMQSAWNSYFVRLKEGDES
jgi:hypothetical protein